MSYPSKEDLEQTMRIAEFAAQRLEDRRQYEFKIFISYVTLLVLAIYKSQLIIDDFFNNAEIHKWCVLFLFLVHLFYILWTIRLSVANRNDANRRNFYLKKAVDISACLLKRLGDPLCRTMDNDYDSIEPEKIKKVPKTLDAWKHVDQIWINYAATFQVVLPTVIFSVLVHILFKNKYQIIPIIPFVFLLVISIPYAWCTLKQCLKSSNKSRQ